ncbi:MAG: hypothetical protein CBC81_000595 [Flavobacteriaceae bacterium TMED121]|nr:hypothetical protein [Candidatus Neomarinimicrobiota bacterium]RPG67421.1 MAG: hypothetical protein CBC81_000595 [Flavobacteriaceae bacterium TMED121]
MKPDEFIHKVETIFHWLIYGMVLFLFGQELLSMVKSGTIDLKNVLTFFIYMEVMQMVSIFFQTGRIPVRYPLYISMIGLARYISFENLQGYEALSITGSIFLLSLALVGLAYRTKIVRNIQNIEETEE